MSKENSIFTIRGVKIGGTLIGLSIAFLALFQFASDASYESPQSKTFQGIHYKAGHTYTYNLDLRVQSLAVLESGEMRGNLELDGKLCIDGLAPEEERKILVRFCETPALKWLLSGQDVGQAALSAGDIREGGAVVRLASDGRATSIAWLPHTSEAAQNLIHGLVPEIAVQVRNDEVTWTREEVNALGVSEARTTTLGWRDAHLHFEKSRLGYRSFHGFGFSGSDHETLARYDFSVSSEGHLDTIGGTEKIEPNKAGRTLKQDSSLKLKLLHRSVTTRKNPDLTKLSPGVLGVPSTSKVTQDRLLRNRVGTMTPASFKKDLTDFAAAGTMPGGNKWFWQAEGLLTLYPELALDLIPIFESPTMNTMGRELLMDLLSGAGSAEAQEAMRQIAKGEAILLDYAGEVAMLQRFMFLKEPTPDTLAFLSEYYRTLQAAGRSREEARRAVGFTLGGLAGMMKRAGLESDAEALTADIRSELAGAERMSQKQALVAALGNAGLEADVDAIVEVAETGDSGCRFAAAIALRTVPNEKARRTLVELGQDENMQVLRKSIQVMEKLDLTKKELKRLDEGLRGRIGSGPESIDYGNLLLNTIQSQSESSTLARDLARAFINQSLGDAKMRKQLAAAINS